MLAHGLSINNNQVNLFIYHFLFPPFLFFCLSASLSLVSLLLYSLFLSPSVSDQKPLSVEVGEASTLMLLGAEQENAELRRRLEELQAHQEVRVQEFEGYDSQK